MRPQSRRTSFSWPLKKAISFQEGRNPKSSPNVSEWVRKSQLSIFASALFAILAKAASSARPLARIAALAACTSGKRRIGFPGRHAMTNGSAAQNPKQPTRRAAASMCSLSSVVRIVSNTSPAPLPRPQVPMPTDIHGLSLRMVASPSERNVPRSFDDVMTCLLSSAIRGSTPVCRWSFWT